MDSDPDWRRAYRRLAFGSLVTSFCGSAPSALYPLYQRKWGFPGWALTVVFAVFVGGIIVALLAAPISNRVGRHPVLLVAIISCLLGTALLLAPGLGCLIGASVVLGFGVGLCQTTVNPALVELMPTGQVDRATLASSRMGALGLATGPLCAGTLAQYAPAPMHLIYLIELLVLSGTLLTLGRTPLGRTAAHGATGPVLSGSLRGPVALLAVMAFFAYAGGAFLNATGSTILVTWLKVDNLALGGLSLALLFSSSALAQTWITRTGPAVLVRAGLVVGAAGLFCVAIAVAAEVAPLMLGAAVLVGMGQGGAYAGSLALLNLTVPGARLATMTSRYYLAAYAGAALPSLAGGWAFAQFGLATAVLLFACAIGAPALVVALLVSRVRVCQRRPNPDLLPSRRFS